jgi:hypothetical protein
VGIFSRILGSAEPKALEAFVEVRASRAQVGPSAGQLIAKAAAIDRRVAARQTDELIGICRGVLLDGAITDGEIRFLAQWLEGNQESAHLWPHNLLYERIAAALADGKISEDEEKELLVVLNHVTGGFRQVTPEGKETGLDTGGLPYDDPAPPVIFDSHSFCVTGDFAYGPRERVIAAIEERRGRVVGAPSGKTNFLVVGITGSTAWKHSTHGTKIIKALELKQVGKPIAIIAEKHWTECL